MLERFFRCTPSIDVDPRAGKRIEMPAKLVPNDLCCGIRRIILTFCHTSYELLGSSSEPEPSKRDSKLGRHGLNPCPLLWFGKHGVDEGGVACRKDFSSLCIKSSIDRVAGGLCVGFGWQARGLRNSVQALALKVTPQMHSPR